MTQWIVKILKLKVVLPNQDIYLNNNFYFIRKMLWHSEVIADFVKSIFWLVQEGGHFLLKQFCNSSSVLIGRNHTKIVRPGDGCLNGQAPGKSGGLARYVFVKGPSHFKLAKIAYISCSKKCYFVHYFFAFDLDSILVLNSYWGSLQHSTIPHSCWNHSLNFCGSLSKMIIQIL